MQARLLSRLRELPYLPYPHFMALAPLDVWLRLLFFPRAAIPLRYWPRLCLALTTSAVATLLTFPERLLLALWLRLKPPAPDRTPAPVFILGYYRSGTTHLHYLLSRDPSLFSPAWIHTLAPQGFILTWTFFRFFLIPLTPATRVIDPTAFSPDAPAEDDFALNNWTLASALPAWILPRSRRFYERFHDLRSLGALERDRWCRYQSAFVRKLSLVARGRRLLLKSPGHTARVETLLRLFPAAKFIHLTRNPRDVLRSNIGLVGTMQRRFGLQDPPPREHIAEEIVHRYVATEQSYLEARARIPKGQIAEVRLQDLLADPLGEIRRIYRELDLPFTEKFEARARDYLGAIRDYRPNVHSRWDAAEESGFGPLLAPLFEKFHHDRPPIAAAEWTPVVPARDRRARAVRIGLSAALGSALAWFLVANLSANPFQWLAWPAGVAIGYSVLRAARTGSRALGLWCLSLTLLVVLGASLVNTRTIEFPGYASVPFAALWGATLERFTTAARLFWTFMGLAAAYRLGSRPLA